MNLDNYLARIGFQSTPEVSFNTLATIHELHLQAIPYENLDVQLGVPLDFNTERIYDKLVTRRRGGWCYEMNGLLGWALTEIGFEVTRMSGAVMRESQGDVQLGNHLVLEVRLQEQAFLADVGLGDGLATPIPIEPGSYTQRGLTYRLEHLEDGFWRFHNHGFSNVASFDFRHAPASEEELQNKCHWLQTDPQSPFMQLLIAQRFVPGGFQVQLGKVHTHVTAAGKTSRTIESAAAMNQHLQEVFGIEQDLTAHWPDLWLKIEAAHARFNNSHP